jgi:anaerobic magnesium-protoporphyrin IX monomethyl ester cyclase
MLKMKILLVRYHDEGDINTRLPESLNRARGVLPPLGIAYIAAVLEKAGYQVKILDAIALNLTTQEVKEAIGAEAPDVVGVTAMTSTVRGALEALQMAKEQGAITVIGGPQLSIYPQETLSYDFVDYGINGEGEYPFLYLVRALERKTSITDIPGLVYKENGKILTNPAYIHLNLDEIPFPARHLLPMEKYSSIISMHPVATMVSSRGCPYQCGFCFKGPSDAKYRMRSAENVVDEMEILIKEYRVKEIMFYDDTLTMNRQHVENICKNILKRGLKIRWESPTRLDRIDAGLLKLMREAGCVRLRYGIESGDPRILKLMKKEISLPQAEEIFRLTRNAGIETFAYFIIGYIRETPETITNTIKFAKKINPDLIMFTLATPYPQTSLMDLAVKDGIVNGDYWKEFTLGKRNERMPYLVPDAEKWIARAYRSFYFRPGYILKRLFKIRSLDEIKKHFCAAMGILSFRMKGGAEQHETD